jgi:hypothetical protein
MSTITELGEFLTREAATAEAARAGTSSGAAPAVASASRPPEAPSWAKDAPAGSRRQ